MKTFLSLAAMMAFTINCNAGIDCNVPTDRILESVVRVTGDDGGKASGVVIAQDVVLTAAHVINGSKSVFVSSDGILKVAKIQSVDVANDLAVLQVSTNDLAPVPLSMNELRNNQPVWAIGYPLGGDMVLSLGHFQDNIDGKLHTSAPIDSGHSGGGLISCEANKHVLAGMLRAYAAYQRGDEYVRIKNFSISVSSRVIEDFIWN